MARPRRSRSRRSLLGSLSLGLLVLGIAISALAWLNIREESRSAARIGAEYHAALGSVAASRAATGSAGASAAVGAPRVVYPERPSAGQVFGTLYIPALEQRFPLVQGTRSADLKKGVGHMVKTALPGEPDNCVISGHRDTVFSRLGKVKVGDSLVVATAAGTFTYQVDRIRIVHKDDRTVVVHTDHALLTVSTCYPFNYVGSAPDRYVLLANLVAWH